MYEQKNAVKISDYPFIPVNGELFKNRIENDAFLLGYALDNYGAKYIRTNYQISLNSIRRDIAGIQGVENVKPDYRHKIRLWSGDWHSSDKSLSYVYEWQSTDNANPDYVYNKFGERVADNPKESDRFFILKSAPLPMEQLTSRFGDNLNASDPYPNSNKIVTKEYVDARHDGIRIVNNDTDDTGTFEDGTLHIRPYACFYHVDKLLPYDDASDSYYLNFDDNDIDQRGNLQKTLKEAERSVTFFLKLKLFSQYWQPSQSYDGHAKHIEFRVQNRPVTWTYENELEEILRQEAKSSAIYLRFTAEYVDNELVVRAGAMFGRGRSSKLLKELRFEDSTTRNISLADYKGYSFISQYYDWDEVQQMESSQGAMQTIDFDRHSLENDVEYTWNYYLLTPDWSGVDENGYSTWNYYRDLYHQFDSNIMWASESYNDSPPKLEANRFYCLEFTQLMDGLLFGRIKWSVSLVKKN